MRNSLNKEIPNKYCHPFGGRSRNKAHKAKRVAKQSRKASHGL